MKREILSLKNIYKFLTSNDYPVYSEGIIKKNNRIGLTLTRFCHENILVDFKNRKCGRITWRIEGGGNQTVDFYGDSAEVTEIEKSQIGGHTVHYFQMTDKRGVLEYGIIELC